MRGCQLIQRPAEHTAKPGVDIAEGGLTRFEADKIGYHAAVNLTADAFHRAVADAGFICRQNVTGGGADNFHQRVGLRTRAHGTHMAVERAAGNGHVLRQTEAFRPLFAERADRNIGGEGVGKQRVCQVFVDDRIEFIEERCRRQPPSFHATAIYARRCNGRGGYPAGEWCRRAGREPSRIAQSMMPLPVRPTRPRG